MMMRKKQGFLLALFVVVALLPLSTVISAANQAIVTVTPTAIPFNAAEIVNPMRGLYRWYDTEPIPQPRASYDRYTRFGWRQLEPSRGQYDFSAIEQALAEAQRAGAKFAFRVMSVNEFTSPLQLPDYLQQTAGGAYCSYAGAPVWVPDWNSSVFLARAQALMAALGKRFNGDPRLSYYDIGVYGHWGEWHTDQLCTPPASLATKYALVDMQIAAFPNTRLLMNSGGNEIDAFLYALNKSPRIGVRVDSLCNQWFDSQFTISPLKLAAMQARWKTAPIIAEFYNWNPSNLAQCNQQVQDWHIAATANGHISTWNAYSAEQQAQLLDIGKHTGYRFVLNSLAYPAEIANNSRVAISSQWSNIGITPAYERWEVRFELQPKGQPTIVWSSASQLDLEQLLPTTEPQSNSDMLYLPQLLPPGEYTLSLIVRDPQEYRAPLALAIAGSDAGHRYTLGNISITLGQPGYNAFVPLAAH